MEISSFDRKASHVIFQIFVSLKTFHCTKNVGTANGVIEGNDPATEIVAGGKLL